MSTGRLDGWTPEKLDELRGDLDAVRRDLDRMGPDVGAIKETLAKMQSDETESLRTRVKELEQRPYRNVSAVLVPFLCACIPALVVVLTHA